MCSCGQLPQVRAVCSFCDAYSTGRRALLARAQDPRALRIRWLLEEHSLRLHWDAIRRVHREFRQTWEVRVRPYPHLARRNHSALDDLRNYRNLRFPDKNYERARCGLPVRYFFSNGAAPQI